MTTQAIVRTAYEMEAFTAHEHTSGWSRGGRWLLIPKDTYGIIVGRWQGYLVVALDVTLPWRDGMWTPSRKEVAEGFAFLVPQTGVEEVPLSA